MFFIKESVKVCFPSQQFKKASVQILRYQVFFIHPVKSANTLSHSLSLVKHVTTLGYRGIFHISRMYKLLFSQTVPYQQRVHNCIFTIIQVSFLSRRGKFLCTRVFIKKYSYSTLGYRGIFHTMQGKQITFLLNCFNLV